MSTSTRIVDLPENITMQMPQQHQQQQHPQQQQQQQQQGGPRNSVISSDQSLSNTYMPMNIHPNPYGQGQSNQGDIPPPQNVHQSMDSYRGNGLPQQQQQQEQRLPSRDFPMDSTNYTHDEAIQPNYIPPPQEPGDYIKVYEETKNRKMMKHEEETYRKETVEDLIAQFQTPIFVALLYFIFQMPFFNHLLYKYLSGLPIFRPDGNINLYGMMLKSVGFAFIYYSMDKIVNYVKYL